MSENEPTTLEHSPFYKEAQISRVEDLSTRPQISLHLLAKNASSCVLRLLENVGPYIDEVSVVLNDTTDDTEALIRGFCEANKKDLIVTHVTATTHPTLYILDTAATYEVGKSLGGEEFAGPFTEVPILADWAGARNLGWDKCTRPWRLFLDADDVVLDPESLPGLCHLLEQQGVDLACSKYHYDVDSQGRPLGASYRERLARNKPTIKWARPIHECLAGTIRISHVDGNLVVRDMRDNKGAGVRIPGRNFKVLYHRARVRNWEVSPRLLADLVMEVRHMATMETMMKFAEDLLESYLREATWPEERGWVLAMVGEMHEGREEWDRAIELYSESLEIHPGAKTAHRLCRAYFNRGTLARDDDADKRADYEKALEAYHLGVANKVVHQVLDDGPLFEAKTKILVGGMLHDLGRHKEAVKFINEALAAFPDIHALGQIKQASLDVLALEAPVEALPRQREPLWVAVLSGAGRWEYCFRTLKAIDENLADGHFQVEGEALAGNPEKHLFLDGVTKDDWDHMLTEEGDAAVQENRLLEIPSDWVVHFGTTSTLQGTTAATLRVINEAAAAGCRQLAFFEDDVGLVRRAVRAALEMRVPRIVAFVALTDLRQLLLPVPTDPSRTFMLCVPGNGFDGFGHAGNQGLVVPSDTLQYLSRAPVPPSQTRNASDNVIARMAAGAEAPWRYFGLWGPWSIVQHDGADSLASPGLTLEGRGRVALNWPGVEHDACHDGWKDFALVERGQDGAVVVVAEGDGRFLRDEGGR